MKKGIYKHYKGKLYDVLGLAMGKENEEKLVLYKALYNIPELEKEYGKNPYFVRPYNIFNENIKIDGKLMPRFEYVGDESIIN